MLPGDDIQMANRLMKKCLFSLTIGNANQDTSDMNHPIPMTMEYREK